MVYVQCDSGLQLVETITNSYGSGLPSLYGILNLSASGMSEYTANVSIPVRFLISSASPMVVNTDDTKMSDLLPFGGYCILSRTPGIAIPFGSFLQGVSFPYLGTDVGVAASVTTGHLKRAAMAKKDN